MFGWLSAWWVRPLIYGLVIVAIAGTAFIKGMRYVQLEWDSEKLHSIVYVTTIQTKLVEAKARIEIQYVERVRVVHDAGQTIIKEIPIYVTQEDNALCAVNAGFVSMWNNANRQDTAAPASGVDQHARSAVELSEVAAQHAREAELANANEERLIADEQYIRDVCSPKSGEK